MIDCHKACAKLQEYLDQELEGAPLEEMRAHLEVCKPCLSHMEFDRVLRLILKKQQVPITVPPLEEKVRSLLRKAG